MFLRTTRRRKCGDRRAAPALDVHPKCPKPHGLGQSQLVRRLACFGHFEACPSPKLHPAAKVVDLSALIRTQSKLDDQPLAPLTSTPPLSLRRPSPARPREPGLAPPARRLQANRGPAASRQN